MFPFLWNKNFLHVFEDQFQVNFLLIGFVMNHLIWEIIILCSIYFDKFHMNLNRNMELFHKSFHKVLYLWTIYRPIYYIQILEQLMEQYIKEFQLL